jgi:hypothetical protein
MQLNLMTSLLELCQSTLLRVNEQSTLVRQTIFDAMEERAIENGQISRHQIITILDDFRNGICDNVREQINAIQQGQACLQEPALHDCTAADGRDVIVRGIEVHCSATVAGSGMYPPHLPSLSVSREMSDGSFGCKACQALQQRVRTVL